MWFSAAVRSFDRGYLRSQFAVKFPCVTLLLALGLVAIGTRPIKAERRLHEQQAEPRTVAPDTLVPTAEVPARPTPSQTTNVPDWIADAVFYQIFPERFRNGDLTNDPTRESLEIPSNAPAKWEITRWTAAWYSRSAWERELGADFYQNGVFDRRYGGDLQGILDQLDYLKELGINAIYLNPVFYARSLHKYDGNSFHHIDPYFGPDPAGDLKLISEESADPTTWNWTAADKLFLELIKQAHARDIRLVIDGVFNHTGRDFFAFRDIRERQQASRYTDWYVIKSFDDPETEGNEFAYQCWWNVQTLPEFANTPDDQDLATGPKAYVFAITSRWMDPDGDGDPQDGIDGWRLDVANELPDKFWVDWHSLVRRINPEAYTVAENWEDAAEYIRRCQFSSTMNYYGFAIPTKGFLIDGAISATDFAALLQQRHEAHSPRNRLALLNLIDSHDTDRVASMIVNARPQQYAQPARFDYDVGERVSPRSDEDYLIVEPNLVQRRIQRLVALFQFTYVGVPMIYYGTESGMWGADDPDDRKPMLWDDLDYDDESVDSHGMELPANIVKFDRGLHDYYGALAALRNRHPALRRGTLQILATTDADKSIVFKRQYEKDTLLVVLNRSGQELSITLDSKAYGIPSQWKVALTSSSEPADVSRHSNNIIIRLPARTGVVLVATAE